MGSTVIYPHNLTMGRFRLAGVARRLEPLRRYSLLVAPAPETTDTR